MFFIVLYIYIYIYICVFVLYGCTCPVLFVCLDVYRICFNFDIYFYICLCYITLLFYARW